MPLALTDPNVAFLVLLGGMLAIYWEVHAPGLLIPGLAGVCLTAVGAFALFRDSPDPVATVFLLAAFLLLAVELKVYTHMISGLAGSLFLAVGASMLFHGPRRIAPVLAISLAITFGIINTFLGYLGMRARKAPVVTGLQTLLGEAGVAKTELNPRGTVFVRGEYWQAESGGPIAAGTPIQVRHIHDLTLFVEAI